MDRIAEIKKYYGDFDDIDLKYRVDINGDISINNLEDLKNLAPRLQKSVENGEEIVFKDPLKIDPQLIKMFLRDSSRFEQVVDAVNVKAELKSKIREILSVPEEYLISETIESALRKENDLFATDRLLTRQEFRTVFVENTVAAIIYNQNDDKIRKHMENIVGKEVYQIFVNNHKQLSSVTYKDMIPLLTDEIHKRVSCIQDK